MASEIDEETRARVVELYLAGTKTADITEETGVGRSSIYFVLDRAGVEPRRQRGGAVAGLELAVPRARPGSGRKLPG